MRVPVFGDLGRRGRGGYGQALYPPSYYYQYAEEPTPKFALVDASGKAITIVEGFPKHIPPGFTVRPITPSEEATGVPGMMGDLGCGGDSLF